MTHLFANHITTIASEPPADTVPVAHLYGKPLLSFPQDLFIPPDALEVFLETFEGPLDLLLYLIHKDNIDILDIPMAELTRQYLKYVDWIRKKRFELAAEYLLMAAVLIGIKARMLLPKPAAIDEAEIDPRAELVKRLVEYEKIQCAARRLAAHPQVDRDFWVGHVSTPIEKPPILPTVSTADLQTAWAAIMQRAQRAQNHVIARETLSVRAHMVSILKQLSSEQFTAFIDLFLGNSSVPVLVVHFLAILELVREQLVEFIQAEPGSTLYVKRRPALDPPITTEVVSD